jgi:hypothetical protein
MDQFDQRFRREIEIRTPTTCFLPEAQSKEIIVFSHFEETMNYITDQSNNLDLSLSEETSILYDDEMYALSPFVASVKKSPVRRCRSYDGADESYCSNAAATCTNLIEVKMELFLSNDQMNGLKSNKPNLFLLEKLENMQLAIRFHEVTALDRENEIDLLQSTADGLQLELDSETDIALKLAACLAAHDDDDEFLNEMDLKDTSVDGIIDF